MTTLNQMLNTTNIDSAIGHAVTTAVGSARRSVEALAHELDLHDDTELYFMVMARLQDDIASILKSPANVNNHGNQ